MDFWKVEFNENGKNKLWKWQK